MSPLALSLRLLQTQPDSRLLALARGGSEPAFEALVRRYRRPLLAYSRRISSGVTAEDILQQALLQAWSALRAGAEVSDARAWLYRIVHNTAISAARSAGERPARLVDAAATYGVDQVVEQRLAAREALTHIAALPALQREVMLGSALEGRSHEELASELGLSGGSVRGLLYRARAAIRSAVAALIPSPLLDWAVRSAAARTGSPYEAVVGGGSVGVAGALIKSGVAATFVGTLAGAAAIVDTHHPARLDHRPRAAVVGSRARPARTPQGPNALIASVLAPPAADSALAGARPAGPGLSDGAAAPMARRIGAATSSWAPRPRPSAGPVSIRNPASRSAPTNRTSTPTPLVSSPGGQDAPAAGNGSGTDWATSASGAPQPAPSDTTQTSSGGTGGGSTSSGSDSTYTQTVQSGGSTSSGSGGDASSGSSAVTAAPQPTATVQSDS